jgi:protein ImuB
LFDQCRALLERWTIPAPIIGVTVSIPATAPLAADQGDLLLPSWRDTAMNAEAVFARLRAVLDPDGGNDVVVHPVAGDTHRLEESARWIPADAMSLALPALAAAAAPSPAPGALPAPFAAALRLLEAPEAVEVEEADGLPDAMWWRGRRWSFDAVDGPERLSGDWWRADAFARDYWRATVQGEGDLLLYREASPSATTGWHLQGWYD